MSDANERFDAEYYNRFYRNPETRVIEPEQTQRQAVFIASYIKHLNIPVRTIVDLGCGLAPMRETLLKQFPQAGYTGVETSQHLCETHGWKHGSVETYRSTERADLLICHDVMQYLDDDNAGRALHNLGELTRGGLFFGVLTREDWELHCDRSRTDEQCHIREGTWYRERLRKRFVNAGGGLFVSTLARTTMWELERAS